MTKEERNMTALNDNYWETIAANGWMGAVTPGIPHDAKIANGSKVSLANRGKVPGIYRSDGTWCGLSIGGEGMNDIVPRLKMANYRRFDSYPTRNVCLLTTHYPCADVDVDDLIFVGAYSAFQDQKLGPTIFRYREGTERGAFGYRFPRDHARVPKVRLEFKLPGGDDLVAIDFLAAGW
jgi:hypothetical protein